MGRQKPGRLTLDELRSALAAPRPRDGFSSHWVTVGGIRTHYRAATGPATGTPIVLLHGLAVSHRYLMTTARPWPRAIRCTCPTFPGSG
jgi:hypothetical protein